MSDVPTDFEKLRPDIYMTDEQKDKLRGLLNPRRVFLERVRNADAIELVAILRYIAGSYKYDGIPQYFNAEHHSVRNLRSVDCDDLYDFLMAVADNIGKRTEVHHIMEGT